MARNVSEPPESPVRHRRSPRRITQSRRDVSSSPPKTRNSGTPSPRTKRLRTAQTEKDLGRTREREYERHNSGRGSAKSNGRKIESEREEEEERQRGKERRERERDRKREEEKMRDRENESERATGDRRRNSGRKEVDERGRGGRDDGRPSRGRHERSASPLERSHRNRRRSHSPERATSSRRVEESDLRGSEERANENDSLAKMKAAEEALEAKKREEPSFELSGKLAAETNRYRGITLLFSEPPDARKPSMRWRLYVFKAGEPLNEPLYIHRQSCYLFGRERRIADIPTDHPSCSKQHAVIQYRQVEKEEPDGTLSKHVRPYIMDLGSTNKTFLNDNPIEPQRYYELFEKDTIRFGNSSREYVLLHENSTG